MDEQKGIAKGGGGGGSRGSGIGARDSRVAPGIEKTPSQTLMHGFGITARELGKFHVIGQEEEALAALEAAGGVRGVGTKLCTDLVVGITVSDQEIVQRTEAYGANTFPEPPFDGFWKLWIESFNDPVLLILIAAAIVSLIVGVIGEGAEGWIDGTAILIAVLIVAFVTAGNDYKKQLQFRALRDDSEAMVRVRVIRNGEDVPVPVSDILVGDIIHLETGDKIVADGVFISGNAFKTDEAAITGESDTVPKDASRPFLLSGTSVAAGTANMVVTAVGIRSVQGAIMADTAMEARETPLQEKLNDMVKVIGYFGLAMAILTFIAMMVSWFVDNSALEDEYDSDADWVIHAFITAVTIIVVAIPEGLPLAVTISLAYSTRKMLADKNLIRVLAACETMGNATDICSDKTGTLTENRMTVVEAWLGGGSCQFPSSEQWTGIPQDSPNFRQITDPEIATMLKDHLAVNSTTVVSWDNNKKPVVRGSKTEGAGVLLVESFGFRYRAIRGAETQPRTEERPGAVRIPSHSSIDDITDGDFRRAEAPMRDQHLDEGAVLIVRQYPFTAERKMMSTLVALDPSNRESGPLRLYVTGASEFVLRRSSNIMWPVASDGRGDANAVNRVVPATPERVEYLDSRVINTLADKALRTLGVAYRDFASRDELPPNWMESSVDWEEGDPSLEEGLTFYGVLGIKDPLRADVKEAVATCHRAGINVRMVTGDNVNTARAIARECGILTSDSDIVIEGPVFRSLTPAQVDAILPHLKVMARSSPRDKNLLVRRLNGVLPKTSEAWEEEHVEKGYKWGNDASLYDDADFVAADQKAGPNGRRLGPELPPGVPPRPESITVQDATLPGYYSEWVTSRKVGKQLRKAIVGVTGDGTNDAPALKAADVGLSMGLSGTQVAKDASDIVILDDRFSSIVKAVLWGRSVFDNIRKFLQFQLTVNVVALILTFIAAVTQRDPPLSPVQLLWVNLIMDTMGALALGTEAPTLDLLDRKPYTLSSSLVSRVMWRNILCQSAFQIVVTLILLYEGEDMFDLDLEFLDKNGYSISDEDGDPVTAYLNTFIFNVFVFCQVFNEFNSRSIGDNWNVWKGLHTNGLFIGVIVVTVCLQLFIVEVGGDFTSTTGLTVEHWGWSILLGSIAVPVGFIMRFIPVTNDPEDYADYYSSNSTAISVAPPPPSPTSKGFEGPRVLAVSPTHRS